MILWFLACGLSSAPDLLDEGEVAVSAPVVALITIDTWRADHLSAELTPTIWALAEEGERYDKAYSPMGLTTPAHATMLTGLYPWEHGVEANNHHGYALRGDVEVLPDQFSGWSSGAFVSAYPAGPEGALARGWDVFEGPAAGERPGATAIDAAMAWLPKDKPSLLWVHVYEPHGPYEGTGATERARYGQEVSRADAALTPLITLLRKRGATIVVTADHGEEFFDHGGFEHGHTLYGELIRVPLVISGPGLARGEVRGVVQHVDLSRGILGLAGASQEGLPSGVDIFALLRDGESLEPSRQALSENVLYGPPRASLSQSNRRLHRRLDRPSGEVWALDDNGIEIAPVAPAERPELFRRLSAGLKARRGHVRAWAPEAGLRLENDETLSQLKALGYLAGESR